MAVDPFLRLLPTGWYQVEFETAVAGSDDREIVQQLVLVFEGQDESFRRLMDRLGTTDIQSFVDPEVSLDDVLEILSRWKDEFFAGTAQVGDSLTSDLFAIARHVAQNEGELPRFFPFEARLAHNLDQIAGAFIDRDLGPRATDEELRREFARPDRFWKALYYHYEQFRAHLSSCVERTIDARRLGADSAASVPVFVNPEPLPDQVVDELTIEEVRDRDGNRCLCCHSTRQLQIDHITPRYSRPEHDPDNLQTLCNTCNGLKQTDTIDFRKNRTGLTEAATTSTRPRVPTGEDAGDPIKWERFVRRVVNFYYRCAAVRSLEVGARGERLRLWKVTLFTGNDPGWLEPHLPELAEEIRKARANAGYRAGPEAIELLPRSGSRQDQEATDNPIEVPREREVSIDSDSVPEDMAARSIDEIDRNEVMGTIRAVFSAGGARDREQAIREVAQALSIRRVGSRVREQLVKDLFTAVLRGILQNDSGSYSLSRRSIDEYTREQLVKILLAAIGSTWLTRGEAIMAAARQLGFRRTGKDIQAAFRSAINSAIRSESIERDGPDNIRKAR